MWMYIYFSTICMNVILALKSSSSKMVVTQQEITQGAKNDLCVEG